MVRIFKRAQCAGSQSQHAGSNFGLFGNRLTGWILPVGNKLAIWNAIVNGCAQGSFHWPCFCCKIVFLLYTSLMGCDPQQNQFYDVEGKGDELERRDPSDSSSSRGSQTRKTPSLVIFHTIHIGTMYIYIYPFIYLFVYLFIYIAVAPWCWAACWTGTPLPSTVAPWRSHNGRHLRCWGYLTQEAFVDAIGRIGIQAYSEDTHQGELDRGGLRIYWWCNPQKMACFSHFIWESPW